MKPTRSGGGREREILEHAVHSVAEQAAKRMGRSLAPADHTDKIRA
jgi:hypothetical protein